MIRSTPRGFLNKPQPEPALNSPPRTLYDENTACNICSSSFMSDVIEHKKTQAQENDDDGPIKDDSLLLEMMMLQI